ncbi:sensor histidine kinase [Nocardia concava]|uniref:sensor histidine kinase n=1 Tax=Nocardia concava TaxID=257281 RepID=UPI0005940845|nr:sensor histidine kinase [Nocardia concava]
MSAGWSQWPERHGRFVDAATAVLLCALATYASMIVNHAGEGGPVVYRSPSLAVFGWSALASLALFFRRRYPRAVLAVTTGCGIAIAASGFELSAISVGAALVAVYSLGRWEDARRAKIAGPVAAVTLLAASFLHDPSPVLTGARISIIAGLLVAGALAEATRNRANYLAALRARAELAERTREDEARQRVGEERVRIARELHDIVAHHMALAHAQASTAAYLLQSKPDQAQEMLDQLADTTAAALRELKATVGLLREDDSDAPLEPTPGLDQLPELLASFERAGLTTTLTLTGARRPLSPGTDLTAYRIIQEALTNVTKHSRTTTATVRLVYSRLLLTISVIDDGPSEPVRAEADSMSEPDSEIAGYGLIGMNERAASVGGHLHAGRRPDGGFEVTTELPLEPQ